MHGAAVQLHLLLGRDEHYGVNSTGPCRLHGEPAGGGPGGSALRGGEGRIVNPGDTVNYLIPVNHPDALL